MSHRLQRSFVPENHESLNDIVNDYTTSQLLAIITVRLARALHHEDPESHSRSRAPTQRIQCLCLPSPRSTNSHRRCSTSRTFSLTPCFPGRSTSTPSKCESRSGRATHFDLASLESLKRCAIASSVGRANSIGLGVFSANRSGTDSFGTFARYVE